MSETRLFRKPIIKDDYLSPDFRPLAQVFGEDEYLPHDMVLLIALQMSVFDVPYLVRVCRFLAEKAETLWQHHTIRLSYEHPPRVFPTNISWHQLFFKHYTEKDKFHRRRALQIIEGDIEALIDENDHGFLVEKVLRIREGFIYHIKISDIFFTSNTCNQSLLQLARALPDIRKKRLLDFFHMDVVTPYLRRKYLKTTINLRHLQSSLILLRNALELPTLQLIVFEGLIKHIIAALRDTNRDTPLIAAIRHYDPAMTLLLLQLGANINEKDQVGKSASDWLFDWLVDKALVNPHKPWMAIWSGSSELIEYCRKHLPSIVEKAEQQLGFAPPSRHQRSMKF